MKKLFINWHKSKTQIFNAILVFIGLLEANTGEFRAYVADDNYGFFIVVIGMVGWYLRTITTKPIEEK